MLITRERQKLINAVIFFSENVRHCGKVKLFKLLYFLDFEHYKVTGRSVTGMEYSAWKMGPVPVSLFEEIESPEPDMAAAISFSNLPVRGGKQAMLSIEPKSEFDTTFFSKREIQLMQALADEYCSSKAEEMVEATHLENLPWDKVYNQQGRKQDVIPYELALRAQEYEQMLQVAQERMEAMEVLR
jgi:uncharacterized phage-associated protein